MKLLFIGDVYGRAGREALEAHLPTLQNEHEPSLTIVNADNAANGVGITEKIVKQFYNFGVDIITGGDHVWGQREILAYIGRDPKLLRPANYPTGTQGNGVYQATGQNGERVVVIHLLGQVFMNDILDNPFTCADAILKQHVLGKTCDAIFIDFHAEATSEKMALAHYLDGRVSAVIGSHTHIPTADAHILPAGTAYQSDAGMTGPYDSIIGADKKAPLHKFVKRIPLQKLSPAKGEGTLCGAIVELKANGLANPSRRLNLAAF